MRYTVNFIIDIDDEDMLESEELEGIVADSLESAAITIRDFRVIDIND